MLQIHKNHSGAILETKWEVEGDTSKPVLQRSIESFNCQSCIFHS